MARGFHPLGQPEIQDIGFGGCPRHCLQHDVGGFDIAVDQPLAVGCMQGLCDDLQDLDLPGQ